MIASENFVPRAVLQAQGSVLTNKYAEGYPGQRYYGGCEQVDIAENLAIARAKALFGAEHANVQPHSGAHGQRRRAARADQRRRQDPRPRAGARRPPHARHEDQLLRQALRRRRLRRGPARRSSSTWTSSARPGARAAARRHHRRLVRLPAPARLRGVPLEIADEVGAKLWVDMAHFAGLVAAGLHPSPVPHADVVSSTVHKTIGGPRSGFILCREEYAKKIDSAVFPGQQGGPLMHVIAAKAVAFKIAGTRGVQGPPAAHARRRADHRRAAVRARRRRGRRLGAHRRHRRAPGARRPARTPTLDGQQAEDLLHAVGITVNRNAVPFDPRPPRVTSGLRIGTPALATRGFGDAEFTEVADIIATALIDGAATDVEALRGPRARSSPTRSRCTPACSSTDDGARSSTARPPRPRSRPS